MKRIFYSLLFTALFNSGNLLAQVNITRDFVVCFANEINPRVTYDHFRAFCDSNHVTVTIVDQLHCIPFTQWIQLSGHANDVLAVVDGIKRSPPHDVPTDPNINPTEGKQKNGIEPRDPPRTDTIPLFNNRCIDGTRGGNPVVIALVDGGIEAVNPNKENNHTAFFAPYLWRHPITKTIGYDFTQPDVNQYPVDSAGHGTTVAGLIVQMFKRFNVVNAKLMILKTQNASGDGRLWDVCRAFDAAVCNEANIVNMSLSGSTLRDTSNLGALNAIIQWMGVQKKMLVVAAAGNSSADVSVGEKIYYAGSFVQPNLINVAAMTPRGDSLWSYSNYGATVNIAAPGVNIPCMRPFNVDTFKSGTSLSTAFVTAGAAILCAYQSSQGFDLALIKASIINGASKTLVGARNVSSQGWLNVCGAIAYFRTQVNSRQGSILTQRSNESMASSNSLQIYPNPFDGALNVVFNLETAQTIELTAVNFLGQSVWSQTLSGEAGVNNASLNTSKWAKGVYTIVVKGEKELRALKTLKN